MGTTRFSNYTEPKQETYSITVGERTAVEGRTFQFQHDKVYSSSEETYHLFQLAESADVTVALVERMFKSLNDEAELEIIWGGTFTAGTELTVFNQNNKYSGNNSFKPSLISAPTGTTVQRETDFLTSTGPGSTSSGDLSADLGFRLYVPGTHFIIRVKNLANSDNRIKFSYTWIEVPSSVIKIG